MIKSTLWPVVLVLLLIGCWEISGKADVVLSVGQLVGNQVVPVRIDPVSSIATVSVGVFATSENDFSISSFDIPVNIESSNNSVSIVGAQNSILPAPNNLEMAVVPALIPLGVDRIVVDDVDIDQSQTVLAGVAAKLFDLQIVVRQNALGEFEIRFPDAVGLPSLLSIQDQDNQVLQVAPSSRSGLIGLQVTSIPEPTSCLLMGLLTLGAVCRSYHYRTRIGTTSPTKA